MAIKTAEVVRSEFARRGESISSWALGKGLNPIVVYDVLSGRKQGVRGQAHRAAVLLGLKEGEVLETSQDRKR